MKALQVSQDAPKTPKWDWLMAGPNDKTCISPTGFWNTDWPKGGNVRCNRTGSILTERGWLCGNHARVWARRKWVNPKAIRRQLAIRARNSARKSAVRALCLTKERCI